MRGAGGYLEIRAAAYARAGVDLALAGRLKHGIQSASKRTHGVEVLGKIGGFGGLYRPDFSGMKDPVLVSSVDGVGTKLRLALDLRRPGSIGADLVNHCVNDIAVVGARPLFFLDYIGMTRLDPGVLRRLLAGIARACRAAGCALIGGETAQMPGMYRRGDCDLAGMIVGVVDRSRILDGRAVRPGDLIIGVASNGLHTNGYALARKILFEKMRLKPAARPAGLGRTLGMELLRPHRNYQPLLAALPHGTVKGAAHITGGGLIENLPRILPRRCDAVIDTGSWKPPPIFDIIRGGGKVSRREMYRVFNMGIGMAIVVSPSDAAEVLRRTRGKIIGSIALGSGVTRLDP